MSLGLALSGPAAAVDLLDLSIEELLEIRVVSATRIAQTPAELPSSMRVVTAGDIRRFGYRTLAEALASVTGVFTYSDGNYEYLGMRGMLSPRDYNSRFLLLIDGQRANDGMYDAASVGHDALVDVDLIERIEVIPGPGAAAYGGNALFGVINVVTRSAASMHGVELAASVESRRGFQTRASFGKLLDNGASVQWSISRYAAAGSDPFYPEFVGSNVADGVARDASRESAESVFGKFTHGGFELQLAWTSRLKGLPTAPWDTVFGDTGTRTRDTNGLLSAHYATRLDGDWKLDTRAFIAQGAYHGTYVYPDPAASLQQDFSRNRRVGGEISLATRRFAGHNLAFGAESVIDYRQEQGTWYEPGATDYWSDRSHSNRMAVFVADAVTLSDRLLLNAALRVDRHSVAGRFVSPRLGLVYRLSPEQVLKATVGRAFKAPSALERNYAPTGYRLNPDLRAEQIRNFDLAWESRPAAGWRATATLHDYRIDGFVDVQPDPVSGDYIARNLPEIHGRGADFDLERDWPGGWRTRAGLSVQRTYDTATASRLVNSPTVLGHLQLAAPLAAGWQLAFDGRYVGARPARQGDAAAYWLANINLTSPGVAHGVEWSLGVYNLFDRKYDWPGSDEHRQILLPQEGRSIRLKGLWRF